MNTDTAHFFVVCLIYLAPVFLLFLAEKITDFYVYSKLFPKGKRRRAAIFAAETAAAAAGFASCAAFNSLVSARKDFSIITWIIGFAVLPAAVALLLIFAFSRLEFATAGEPGGVNDAAQAAARLSAPVMLVFIPVYFAECVFALDVILSEVFNVGGDFIADLASVFARRTGSLSGPPLALSLIGVTFAFAVFVKCVIALKQYRAIR